MSKLQIIVGSTRPDRGAERIFPWVLERAREHGAFDVELLDLRNWPLPFFGETIATVGDFANPTYSLPLVKQWNTKIAEGDAYIFITPEYNHSVSGVLKNAIDSVFVSFALRNKPAAFVGYSGAAAGGARAVEHLAHIVIEAEMVPLRNTVLVGQLQSAFGADGKPVNPLTEAALQIMLDDLQWWSTLLEEGRKRGSLQPGTFRMRAAMAANAART